MEPTRKFIREGLFIKVIQGSTVIKYCTVILFNDILLLAVKKWKGDSPVYAPKSPKIPLATLGFLVWDEKSGTTSPSASQGRNRPTLTR